MSSFNVLAALVFLSFTGFAHAQSQTPVQPEKSKWAHESELGIATVAGNTDSETYNVKQKTSYVFDLNQMTASARYLRTTAGGTESARNWDASLRYDRTTSTKMSVFTAYSLESDPYAGYVQRNNADIGVKYEIAKSIPTTWLAELGFRNTQTQFLGPAAGRDSSSNFIRVYSEVAQVVSSTSSLRFWIEYLPSIEDSDLYRINLEPSLVSQLNSLLSLKVGYLVKYQNQIVPPVTEHTDRFFTTALVAKF